MSRFPTKEEDSQASVAAVWRRYWRQMRSRKGSLFLILFSYGTASVLASAVVPWVYRFLIDSLSVNAPGAIAEIAQIFWLLAAIILLYNILFRLGDYFIVLFQTEIMRQLEKTVFAGTIKHSLDFFADNFVGSLVAKA
ncbi:MAG TPA: ABC transporter ATP-binding protein, partial [Candidatus Moranbacteria bacterium]|nr:ABC transporter ATP-binding protein [Candidatus Moranbacteria bacterium]